MRSRMKSYAFVFIVMSTLLCACSSPRMRTYMLQPVAAEQTVSFSESLGIGPVNVADYLHNTAIVTSTNNYLLTQSELDQWGEPLDKAITRVVAENLVVLSGSEKIRTFPWRSDEQPSLALKIQVLSLNADDSTASMRVRWTLRKPDGTQPVDEGYRAYHKDISAHDYEIIARAYSELLAQFSRDMANKIVSVATKRSTKNTLKNSPPQ